MILHVEVRACLNVLLHAAASLSPAVFRMEPFILAVEAKDMQAAQRFIRTARQAGFRESGATVGDTEGPTQRIMVGIRCSIRLEVTSC